LIELYNEKLKKSTSKFAEIGGKFTEKCRKFAERYRKNTGKSSKIRKNPQKCGTIPQKYGVWRKIVYRDRICEIMKEKGISKKQMEVESGVSVDTLERIVSPDNPDKDSPKVNTIERICKVLGIEIWELFYVGDKSLVGLQAELTALREERDALLADDAALKIRVETLRDEVNRLKDEMLDIFRFVRNEITKK
jgi:transcriptional regulator with XRE-family HTH domain